MKQHRKSCSISSITGCLIWLALASLLILGGCVPQAQVNMLERNVSGLQIENQRINNELAAIKKKVNELHRVERGTGPESVRRALARLNSRMDTLESELMRINGLLEQSRYRQDQQDRELARVLQQLHMEPLGIVADTNGTAPPVGTGASGAGVAVNSTPGSTTVGQEAAQGNVSGITSGVTGGAGEVQQPPAENKPDMYQQALELYRQGKYQEAKRLFRDFIRQNPGSPMVANAHFWIGDCEYRLSRFEEAILEYQKVISKFPESNKVPDALLKQGFAFARIGDTESARIVLKKLIKNYPSTPQAKAARKQLQRLG